MMKKSLGISTAVICLALIFAGCGGGGGGGTATPTGTTISGTVSAPSGVSLGRSAGRSAADSVHSDFVFRANVTIKAFLIDDNGDRSGDFLASGESNSSGIYSLVLPVGVSTASNLVVAAVDSSDNVQMRAIVTSTSVSINPITELVTSEIVASSQALSNFTVTEIISIQTQVENDAASVDLTGQTTVNGCVATLDNDSAISSNLDMYVSSYSSSGSSIDIADYETIAVGDIWSFDEGLPDTSRSEYPFVMGFIETKTINGTTTYGRYDGDSTDYFAFDSSGNLYLYGIFSNDTNDLQTYSPPLLFGKANMTSGESWNITATVSHSNGSQDTSLTATTTVTQEMKAVNAGTYNDCLKFVVSFTEGSDSATYTHWSCRGLGRVYFTDSSGSDIDNLNAAVLGGTLIPSGATSNIAGSYSSTTGAYVAYSSCNDSISAQDTHDISVTLAKSGNSGTLTGTLNGASLPTITGTIAGNAFVGQGTTQTTIGSCQVDEKTTVRGYILNSSAPSVSTDSLAGNISRVYTPQSGQSCDFTTCVTQYWYAAATQ